MGEERRDGNPKVVNYWCVCVLEKEKEKKVAGPQLECS